MEHIKSLIIKIIIVFSVGMNIALLTSEQNDDKMVLDIAEHSYFVGCCITPGDAENCKKLSKQFRKDFSERTGLEDSTK